MMSNRILNYEITSAGLGLAAVAFAFSAMSAHPAPVTESTQPITIAQAGQTGTSSSGTGSQGSTGSTSSGATGQGATGSTSSGATTPGATGTASGTGATSTTPSGTAAKGATGSTGSATNGTSAATGGTTTSTTTAKLASADRDMIRQFAAANLAEIEMAKLAQSKSQNDQVKTYAQRMIDDHTSALNDLTQLASTKGVELPSKPDAQHQAVLKKLNGLSGAAFDKQYLAQAGTADHRKVHTLLSRMSTRARDQDVKALADKTLPAIDQHMRMAKDTQAATTQSSSGK